MKKKSSRGNLPLPPDSTHGKEPSIESVTASYEAWMRSCTNVLQSDLRSKHEQMREAPFGFLRGSFYRSKIRNVMSILFNHAIRHDLFDRNPIQWVRQSAKRTNSPTILSVSEIRLLLPALGLRERTLVLLDARRRVRRPGSVESEELTVRRCVR
jgi:site-specific recombinase XerD